MSTRAKLKWPGFLTPDKPSETAALLTIVAIVASAIGYGFRAVLPASTPWQERADEICLHAGDDFLNVSGSSLNKLSGRLQVIRRELAQLEGIAVPPDYVLGYNTMLSDKKEELTLLSKALALAKRGKPQRYEQELVGPRQAYAVAAEQLPLHVCGQGTGHG